MAHLSEITRKEAKTLGLKRYFTNISCPKNHVCERYVNNGKCVDCCNSLEYKALRKAWYERNKDHALNNIRKYRKENQDKIAITAKKWRENSIPIINARTAKRRAAKLTRTPLWLTPTHLKDIKKFYEQAQREDKTVDHIIPLQGKNVCGLHVPWNLQLLTFTENVSKGNRLAA